MADNLPVQQGDKELLEEIETKIPPLPLYYGVRSSELPGPEYFEEQENFHQSLQDDHILATQHSPEYRKLTPACKEFVLRYLSHHKLASTNFAVIAQEMCRIPRTITRYWNSGRVHTAICEVAQIVSQDVDLQLGQAYLKLADRLIKKLDTNPSLGIKDLTRAEIDMLKEGYHRIGGNTPKKKSKVKMKKTHVMGDGTEVEVSVESDAVDMLDAAMKQLNSTASYRKTEEDDEKSLNSESDSPLEVPSEPKSPPHTPTNDPDSPL